MLLAYVGPDAVMPMASVAAAVAGGLLMFGRTAFRAVARVARRLARART